MTDHKEHSLTPSPELIKQWADIWYKAKVKHVDIYLFIAIQAARWGADLELKACAEWVYQTFTCGRQWADDLRATRRPKPQSLKEKTLEDFDALMSELDGAGNYSNCADRIRHAIQSIPDNV